MSLDSKRPLGQITTLLDLTNRDLQENDMFPLNTAETWFTRDTERRVIPFSPVVQEIPFRGPAAFGQRFTFDVGSLSVGDLLYGVAVQIHLDHWLDAQSQLQIQCGSYTYVDPTTAWTYANSLGTSIIQEAELEIDGQTIETIDGDFINVFSRIYEDFNSQFGVSYDHLGAISQSRLVRNPPALTRLYPTENGILHCILPFGFVRTRYKDSLPMIAIREGLVRIHITLRPFSECVRQVRGYRDSCTATPLNTTIAITNGLFPPTIKNVKTSPAPPQFKSLQLVTFGAILTGKLREKMLYEPFEQLYREVQTFSFDEPLKYAVGTAGKAGTANTVRIQLPLEANHPLEEILWIVRRKDVALNNNWTNYTAFLETTWPARDITVARKPMLQNAILQANGVTLIDAEEQYFRSYIASAHRGGLAAYNSFIYGFPFSREPGEHQPSGTMNASRLNSLRLTLDVMTPADGALWEVKVFCIGLNWMRYENGMANTLFSD